MARSLEQIKAQKAKYLAKARQLEAAERRLKRKADTRQKIVAGAIFLKPLRQFEWLDLNDEEVLTKLANHLADQVERGFPAGLRKSSEERPAVHVYEVPDGWPIKEE